MNVGATHILGLTPKCGGSPRELSARLRFRKGVVAKMNASARATDVLGTARFADMIEQSPDALLLVDGEGLIAYANQIATELFGVSAAEVPPQAVQAFIPGFAGPRDGLLTGRRGDGSEFPLDVRIATIQSDGREWTLASLRDATQRQGQLEEVWGLHRASEEAARSKSQFLALAAHDLSQPMQSIAFALSAAERCVPRDSEAAALIALATTSTRRIRNLLSLLLEISRLESATMHAADECEQVRDIFADLEEEFAPLARAKGLTFHTEPGAHMLRTDPTLVRTLLANLVSNAVRYTSRGQVVLRCSSPAHGGLKLSVHDTGIGIPQTDLPSIFEEFKRLDVAREAHRDGFGLGLAIVRRLSELLGASIAVESRVGVGSVFTVEFPATRASSP